MALKSSPPARSFRLLPMSSRQLYGIPPFDFARFEAADGEWRAAFAFDPDRKAILLATGDKSGGSEKRFYRQLIKKADKRFSAHVRGLKAAKKGK